jgi:hypothetical protein
MAAYVDKLKDHLTGPITLTILPRFFKQQNNRGYTLIMGPPEEKTVVPGDIIPVYTAVTEHRMCDYQKAREAECFTYNAVKADEKEEGGDPWRTPHYYFLTVDGVDYIVVGKYRGVVCAVELKTGDYDDTREGVRTVVKYTNEPTGRKCGCGEIEEMGWKRRHVVTKCGEVLHEHIQWVRQV